MALKTSSSKHFLMIRDGPLVFERGGVWGNLGTIKEIKNSSKCFLLSRLCLTQFLNESSLAKNNTAQS